jgi:predicted transglutaminase-like cysteine proteinase
LPTILVILLFCLAGQTVFAAAKGRQYGPPLKFDAPPVDLAPSPDAREDRAPAPQPRTTRASPARVRETLPERSPSGTEEPPAPPEQEARPLEETRDPPEATAQNRQSAPADALKPVRLFGTVEFRSPVKNLPKWERVRNSEQQRPTFVSRGVDAQNAAVSERWRNMRDKLRAAPLAEQIKAVNNFFNQWPYKTDMEVWGVEDYWETPREFIERSGDCEDYAISKYYALRDLGVPAELLRVVAVKDAIRNYGHAICVVFVNDDAVILDNLTNLTLSHKRLTHYKPQFSVNENFLWRHIQPQSGPTR